MKKGLLWRGRRYLRRKLVFIWTIWSKSRRYRRDPIFNLALLRKGFADHREQGHDDEPLLDRVIRAYQLAKKAQAGEGPSYHPSDIWLPLYVKQLGEVMGALGSGDKQKLGAIYGNFFRDPCSSGLHGLPLDMNRHLFGKRISGRYARYLLIDVIHRYGMWRNLVGKDRLAGDLATPMIGNPYGVFIDGVFVTPGASYHHYYATLIARLLREEKRHKTVVELGGGYGGMGYFLVRDNPDLTYLDFDLPENMALTAYYLLKAFPDKKILLYGEGDLTSEAIREYSILVMPSFEMRKLADRSASLAFNSFSLAEMSPGTVATFIGEFNRITNRYILHANHSRTSTVVADDFPIDLARFDLLYKIPALWNFGINPDMDEYEYLYRRADPL